MFLCRQLVNCLVKPRPNLERFEALSTIWFVFEQATLVIVRVPLEIGVVFPRGTLWPKMVPDQVNKCPADFYCCQTEEFPNGIGFQLLQ